MRKDTVCWLFLLVAAGTLPVALWPPDQINEVNFRKIMPGMKELEVEWIFGEPATRGGEVLPMRDKHGQIVGERRYTYKIWIGESLRARIRFDAGWATEMVDTPTPAHEFILRKLRRLFTTAAGIGTLVVVFGVALIGRRWRARKRAKKLAWLNKAGSVMD